jgi:hypothetical protein
MHPLDDDDGRDPPPNPQWDREGALKLRAQLEAAAP